MKKGFTLVELLAVIVILAIIALITVPIIMNIVESSKKATSVESANGYVRAVTNYLIMNVVDDGIYSVFDSNIKAEYTGTKVSNGSITIEKGDIKKANLCINDYSIDYINGVSSISNNDYCKDTNNKTLIVKKNNEELKSIYIGESTSTEIEKEDVTNIVCNNGVTIKEENGKIKLENILSNSECNFNSNLEDTINKIDNTTNNILLLNDIELENTLTIIEGKNIVLDLNGKTINGNLNGVTNNGSLTFKNSSDDDSYFNVSGTALVNSENAIADLQNVKLISSSSSQGTSTILNRGNLKITKCYIEGPYGIGWNDKPTMELNIYNSEVVGTINNGISFNTSSGGGNIYSSTVKGKVYAVYFNSTGTLNIYSGTFISETTNAISNFSSGTINIKQTDNPVYITSLATIWAPAVNNSGGGTLNISGSQADKCTANESDTKSGICIYAEGDKNYTSNTANCGIRNVNNSVANIDGATIYAGHQGINNDGIMTITNSNVSSNNYAILSSGTANIKNSSLQSFVSVAVYNQNSGIINIDGSKITSAFVSIYNNSSKDINITDKSGRVYIYSDGTTNTSIWSAKAITNNSSGNVRINGSSADKCTDIEENTSGICIYNGYGRTILNENGGTGNIYINGASIVSKVSIAVNNHTGNIYICSAKINGNTPDIQNSNTGYIYYTSNVVLENNTTKDGKNDPSHIVLNNEMTCE